MNPEDANRCPLCNGTGFLIVEGEGHIGHARPCDCAAQRYQAQARIQASIPERFSRASFDNFSTAREGNPVAARLCSEAIRKSKGWARELYDCSSGLLFTGAPGCGKTHLAVAALKAVMDRGFRAMFCDYQTMISAIARSWSRDAGREERGLFDRVVETDILLIDDLGATRALEWAEDIVTDIITARYNANKALLVTTNLPLFPALPDAARQTGFVRPTRALSEIVGMRSASRLQEMCTLVDMGGIDDYRAYRANPPRQTAPF